MKLLVEEGDAVSKQIFEQYKTKFNVAQAAYEQAQAATAQAQAALEQLEVSLDETEIKITFAGIITAKYVEEGSMISQISASNSLPATKLQKLSAPSPTSAARRSSRRNAQPPSAATTPTL